MDAPGDGLLSLSIHPSPFLSSLLIHLSGVRSGSDDMFHLFRQNAGEHFPASSLTPSPSGALWKNQVTAPGFPGQRHRVFLASLWFFDLPISTCLVTMAKCFSTTETAGKRVSCAVLISRQRTQCAHPRSCWSRSVLRREWMSPALTLSTRLKPLVSVILFFLLGI